MELGKKLEGRDLSDAKQRLHQKTTQQLNVSLCTVVILGNLSGKHILHRKGPRCECPLSSRKVNAAANFHLILTFLSMRGTSRKKAKTEPRLVFLAAGGRSTAADRVPKWEPSSQPGVVISKEKKKTPAGILVSEAEEWADDIGLCY